MTLLSSLRPRGRVLGMKLSWTKAKRHMPFLEVPKQVWLVESNGHLLHIIIELWSRCQWMNCHSTFCHGLDCDKSHTASWMVSSHGSGFSTARALIPFWLKRKLHFWSSHWRERERERKEVVDKSYASSILSSNQQHLRLKSFLPPQQPLPFHLSFFFQTKNRKKDRLLKTRTIKIDFITSKS